jgi:predicted ATPase
MQTLAVENYRSLRHLVIPLGPLNVITGANGSGKSSLYRALRLLADASRNGAVAALAREGGLDSALWAGPDKLERSEEIHPLHSAVRTGTGLRLGFAGDTGDFSYAIDLGKPPRDETSKFNSDPDIKREVIWSGPVLRPSAVLADRNNSIVRIRGADGGWPDEYFQIKPYDSMLSEFADPQRAPEVVTLRDLVRSWRFYDHVRTDSDAPARGSRVGTRTAVLSHDGADLAAALQTIREIGDPNALSAAIDLAFPGSRLSIASDEAGRFDLRLSQPGLHRPLAAPELSDGTLRYLLWVAVLLTSRPPPLLVLNEPETSLHPDLLTPLAQLIVTAAARSQLIVVSHSRPLITTMRELAGSGPVVNTIELAKHSGQTLVVGQEPLDAPAWQWPKRLPALAGGIRRVSVGIRSGRNVRIHQYGRARRAGDRALGPIPQAFKRLTIAKRDRGFQACARLHLGQIHDGIDQVRPLAGGHVSRRRMQRRTSGSVGLAGRCHLRRGDRFVAILDLDVPGRIRTGHGAPPSAVSDLAVSDPVLPCPGPAGRNGSSLTKRTAAPVSGRFTPPRRGSLATGQRPGQAGRRTAGDTRG